MTSLGSGDKPHGGTDVVHVQPLRTMTDVGWLRTAVFVPHTKYIVVGGDNAKVFDAMTGTLVHVLEVGWHEHMVRSVALIDDTRLVCAGVESVVVWDVVTGDCVSEVTGHGSGQVMCLATSSDGSRVAIGNRDGTLMVGQALALEHASSYGVVGGPVFALVWLSGNKVVVASREMRLLVWSVDEEACDYVWLYGYAMEGPVTCMCAMGDGRRVVVGGATTISVWDVMAKKMVQVYVGHGRMVTSVALSPDARRLASGDRNGILKVWDALSGECLMTRKQGICTVSCVAWSPDGFRVATGSDEILKIWETRRFRRVLHCMLRRRAGTGMAAVSTNVTEKQKRLFEFVYGLPYVAAAVGLPVLPDELFKVVCVYLE